MLLLDGQEYAVNLIKVDREKLYGTVDIEAFDEHGHEASLKVLAADGDTLIDKGGTALEYIDDNGNSLYRDELQAVDREGNEMKVLPSSFAEPNELMTAEIDDYLSLIVKSVYLLQPAGEAKHDLVQHIRSDGTIYSFPFRYRDAIDTNDAFVIGNKKDAFLVIGKKATFDFVKLNQAVALDAAEDQDISGDDLDFDLL